MKYKVGDQVRLKTLEELTLEFPNAFKNWDSYSYIRLTESRKKFGKNIYYNKDMVEQGGKTGVITFIDTDNTFQVTNPEFGEVFWWDETMVTKYHYKDKKDSMLEYIYTAYNSDDVTYGKCGLTLFRVFGDYFFLDDYKGILEIVDGRQKIQGEFGSNIIARLDLKNNTCDEELIWKFINLCNEEN
jgi:hypothetical protein